MDKNFYFILGSDDDYYKIIYNDVITKKNVKYLIHPVSCNILRKIQFSKKINGFIKMPFKYKYYDYIFDSVDLKKYNKIYFLVFARYWVDVMIDKYFLLEYLKKRFSTAKFICYFQDLISENNDISKIKTQFDAVVSYDYEEAKKYKLFYHPTPFSKIKLDKIYPECDVYFLGRTKGRIDIIFELFNIFSKEGFKCNFFLKGVAKKNQLKKKGLHYIKYMPYEENLSRVLSSKFVLEVNKAKSTGSTLRTWEAISYNKLLLTNNKYIKNNSFLDSKNIVAFNTISEIDFEKLKKIRPIIYSDSVVESLSPIELLKFINSISK